MRHLLLGSSVPAIRFPVLFITFAPHYYNMKLCSALQMGLLVSSVQGRPVNNAVRLLYRYELGSDKHGVAAFNVNGELIGSACDSTLKDGSFSEQPITMQIDPSAPWMGQIKVGNNDYAIHSNPPDASHPTCTRIYSKTEVELECLVLMTGLEQDVFSTDLLNVETGCFDDVFAHKRLMEGTKRYDSSLAEEFPDFEGLATNVSDLEPVGNLRKSYQASRVPQEKEYRDDWQW